MRLSPPIIVAIFAGLILLPILFCPGATEVTSVSWRYGTVSKTWHGLVLLLGIGSGFVFFGILKRDATVYFGYFLLMIGVVGAFRLC